MFFTNLISNYPITNLKIFLNQNYILKQNLFIFRQHQSGRQVHAERPTHRTGCQGRRTSQWYDTWRSDRNQRTIAGRPDSVGGFVWHGEKVAGNLDESVRWLENAQEHVQSVSVAKVNDQGMLLKYMKCEYDNTHFAASGLLGCNQTRNRVLDSGRYTQAG